jgi:TonB-dependent receptor
MSEDSRKRDSYIASESLVAGYAMVDFPFEIGTMPVRVIAGARVESSQQILNSYDATDAPVNVNLDIVDVLPSINVVVTPFENFNVRAAATQTLTRPSLREFAPFQFYDFQSQSATQGNPDLTRALVQNYDLRLEWFPGAGEVISVSAFYKNFLNAIEETIIPSGGSTILYTFANANGPATNYGVEFEVRKNLGFIATPLQYLVASANVALITSEVTVKQVNVDDTRQMWGQSPYTINLGLSYFNPDWGTTISAGYNIAGDRIVKVAQQGVYQVPAELADRGPHVYELGRDMIDFSVAQTFGNLEMKAAIRDILNQPLVWEQIGQTVASNLRGRGYSLSIGYRFN